MGDSWAGPGDPEFNESDAVADRREMLLGLPWPGSVAVACSGAERLIVAADQVFPEDLRAVAQDLVEAAWAEVLHTRATEEEVLGRVEVAVDLYPQAEMVTSGRVFVAIEAGCMVAAMVWGALEQPDAGGAKQAMRNALESVANWARHELLDTYGSGDRYATADIYRSDAFVRELAAWDADIDTVQQRGVTAESVAQIRQRAHDVGVQHQQTIIRALTVDAPSNEERRRRRREGP